MSYRVLPAQDAFWRPSNQMRVLNTDLAKQLGADGFGARLWRLAPGQASTRHRHRTTTELYVLLEGTGRVRIDRDLLTLTPLSSVIVEPAVLRQVFNDTDAEQLWLSFGVPPEGANTLELHRRRPESNRCRRLCRPLRSHSATSPRDVKCSGAGERYGLPGACALSGW